MVSKNGFLPFQVLALLSKSRETFGPQSDKYWILIYKTHKFFGKDTHELDWLFGICRNAAAIALERIIFRFQTRRWNACKRQPCETYFCWVIFKASSKWLSRAITRQWWISSRALSRLLAFGAVASAAQVAIGWFMNSSASSSVNSVASTASSN